MSIDIQQIIEDFPEFLRPIDLIEAGLYKSRSDLCWSMKRGLAPPHIRLSPHKIVFPRASLCEWLKAKIDLAAEVCNVKC